MSKQINYFNNDGGSYFIIVDDQVRGVGPLDQLHELRFLIKKDSADLFHASIRATDEFLKYLFRSMDNRAKSDYEVLLDLGLLKVKIAIESNVKNDFEYVFNTNNGPPTYELWEQELLNEYAWSKIELVKLGEDKFIIYNGYKNYIPDSITRCALGFRKSLFIPKTQKEVDSFRSGKNVDEIKSVRLIRQLNNPDPIFAVFTIPTLEKRHVPNPDTLEAIGRKQDEVESLFDEEFKSIPTGKELQSVNLWDIELSHDKNTPTAKPMQSITIGGNVGQFNAGEVSNSVSNADQRHIKEKIKWWENSALQIVFLISALIGIISFVTFIFNK